MCAISVNDNYKMIFPISITIFFIGLAIDFMIGLVVKIWKSEKIQKLLSMLRKKK